MKILEVSLEASLEQSPGKKKGAGINVIAKYVYAKHSLLLIKSYFLKKKKKVTFKSMLLLIGTPLSRFKKGKVVT